MACDTLNMFDVGGVVYRENFYYHYFCAGMHCIDGGCSGSAGKRRSMEGKLVQFTTVLAVLFIVLAVILNLNF